MKKILAMLLVAVLISGLAIGCTKKQEDLDDKDSKVAETTENKASDSSDVITIKYLRPGIPPEKNDELIAAINTKLATDETGLQFDIMYIPSDVYHDKAGMMLSTGDEFDILCVMEDQKPLTSFIAMEGVLPITKYIDEYGTNLKRVIPDWMWESAKINGEIYTIPANWTEIADQGNNITIRHEKLKEYGLGVPETREDLLHMAEVFTENWEDGKKPVIIPMYKEPFTWLFRTLDSYPFTVQKDLLHITQEGVVASWLETEEFKSTAEFFEELNDKGYIPSDILASGWSSWNTMLTGDFIWVDGCQLWGTEAVWGERIPGVELDTVYLNPGIDAFRPHSFRNDNAISATSNHPAEAVQFMDWMHASQENYDLVVYGVEGLTYTDKGEGLYEKMDPDFEFNPDYMIGNLEYIRYEVGTYEKFIEIMGVEKPDAVNSVVLNFSFDPAAVANEYANCQSEVERSIYPIKLGIVSYEEGYQDALDKMKAAGIDKVVEEYQRQLDEYLKNN